MEVVEDAGARRITTGVIGGMRKLSEDDGRWQFDVLQSSRVAVCVCRLKHIFGGQAELMHFTVIT